MCSYWLRTWRPIKKTPYVILYWFSFKIILCMLILCDSVDHNILLEKLRCYGVTGSVFDWFADYLSGRTQRVVELLIGVQSHQVCLREVSLDQFYSSYLLTIFQTSYIPEPKPPCTRPILTIE